MSNSFLCQIPSDVVHSLIVVPSKSIVKPFAMISYTYGQEGQPLSNNIDITKTRYDSRLYSGRVHYFYNLQFPANFFASTSSLVNAKTILDNYKKTDSRIYIKEDQLWAAKHLYDSSFHPETGKLIPFLGRFSAQVPINTVLTAALLTLYRTNINLSFWQWAYHTNQAFFNYCNKRQSDGVSGKEIFMGYVVSTASAIGSVLFLQKQLNKFSLLVQRLLPFYGIAIGHFVNVPIQRLHTLRSGIPVYDHTGHLVGSSKNAAAESTIEVVLSKILSCIPSVVGTAFFLDYMSYGRGTTFRYPYLKWPLALSMASFTSMFGVPLGSGVFQNLSTISKPRLEKEVREKLDSNEPPYLYYTRGLCL